MDLQEAVLKVLNVSNQSVVLLSLFQNETSIKSKSVPHAEWSISELINICNPQIKY